MPGNRPAHLALVGGFLGAGKTTLLLAAGRILKERGLRVAILTNDQGGDLVDTRLAAAGGFESGEVAGGCFCCRFQDFVHSLEGLLDWRPDVVFAEPVGSCMDIAATVLAPLQRSSGDAFRLAPFTVLVDPDRAREMLSAEADPELSYLFRNQLAEADLVYFTKPDLYASFPELPGGAAGTLGGRSGAGVAEWLDLIFSGRIAAGARPLAIDYGRYARAEAALGWLNWRGTFRARRALTPAAVVGPLMDSLDARLTAAGVTIMHLKVFGQCAGGYVRAGICRNGEDPQVDGDLAGSAAVRHELIVNLRALGDPELLRAAVAQSVAELPGAVMESECQAFRPAAPVKPL